MVFIEYGKRGNVAVITLNRPERLNAMGREMNEGLLNAFKTFEADSDARVAILTGAGRAFCAGPDIKEQRDDSGKPFVPVRVFDDVELVSKPVIAAINGMALGGGCLLTLVCDFRIAAKSATFGMPEINRAIPYPPQRFFALGLPAAAVLELLMTGEQISAQRAYDIGLVNKVVPDEELMAEAMKLAERIAGLSPWAVQKIKQAKIKALSLSAEDLQLEKDFVTLARTTDDFQEAAKAVTEKRKPVFKPGQKG